MCANSSLKSIYLWGPYVPASRLPKCSFCRRSSSSYKKNIIPESEKWLTAVESNRNCLLLRPYLFAGQLITITVISPSYSLLPRNSSKFIWVRRRVSCYIYLLIHLRSTCYCYCMLLLHFRSGSPGFVGAIFFSWSMAMSANRLSHACRISNSSATLVEISCTNASCVSRAVSTAVALNLNLS